MPLSLNPLTSQTYSHENMHTNSFYVRLSTSPCGRWLACGGAAAGSAFLYDVSNAYRSAAYPTLSSPFEGHSRSVQIQGQTGEVSALDWADSGTLATCADDGTVRVWRPDVEVWRQCIQNPEDCKWEWAYSWRQ